MALWVPVCMKCRLGSHLAIQHGRSLVVELPWQRREEQAEEKGIMESQLLWGLPCWQRAHTENQTVNDTLGTSRLPRSQ